MTMMNEIAGQDADIEIAEKLFDEQLELELEMSGLGYKRVQNTLDYADKRNCASTKPGERTLMGYAIPMLSQSISDWIAEAMASKGRRHSAAGPLSGLEADVSAFITMRFLFDTAAIEMTIQSLAVKLGAAIEQECRYAWYEEQNPGYFKALKDYCVDRNLRQKKVIFGLNFKKKGYEVERWKETTKLHVGLVLIELAEQTTGYFKRTMVDQKLKDTPYRLALTEKTMEWIGRKVEKHSALCPVYLPTVVKPKAWTGPIGGGYHHPGLPQMKLVKTRHKAYMEELESHHMPLVYAGINAVQDTAWKINCDVLEVLEWAWEHGGGIGKLPSTADLELAPVPDLNLQYREEWTEENKQTWKEWKWAAKKVYKSNVKLRSKRLSLMKMRWVADKFRDYSEIFFPQQMDFRGRLYSVPNYLNPQGCDVAKGLLTFATGKPIVNKDQVKWLAVHGANNWGEDKCTLDQRVHWVRDNEAMIKAIAEDPLENQDWADADKPFQFLAWCFEWAGFMEEGYGYISHIPIAMDGSCNGLQIFSLILRDPIGGHATNLLPTDLPQDIYQIVADKVIASLEEVIKTSDDADQLKMAHEWLEFGVTRKTTKRQVMVLPYGGTFRSCQNYTIEHIEDRIEDGAVCPWGDDVWPAGMFLASYIWRAIESTVVAARECMGWLQKTARLCSKMDMPVNWQTPVGFPVMQSYEDFKNNRVKTKLGEVVIKLTIKEGTGKLDKVRQANAISPNFVHSLDASALILSVCKSADKGVTHFGMVHDSYATHAADAPVLARSLREAFVEMFDGHMVLEKFLDEIRPILGEKIKDVPEMPLTGNLNVADVLDSPYFFA